MYVVVKCKVLCHFVKFKVVLRYMKVIRVFNVVPFKVLIIFINIGALHGLHYNLVHFYYNTYINII